MKKVIIMRHSKSSDVSLNMKDFDRPLNECGLIDASLMGDYLYSKNLIPDLIICSTALRTRMTTELVLKKLKTNIEAVFNPIIYENIAGSIIKLIAQTDDRINTLMIVGHNPSMLDITEYLTNSDFPYSKFSTSGVAVINFDFNGWYSIIENHGKLESFTSPKMLI